MAIRSKYAGTADDVNQQRFEIPAPSSLKKLVLSDFLNFHVNRDRRMLLFDGQGHASVDRIGRNQTGELEMAAREILRATWLEVQALSRRLERPVLWRDRANGRQAVAV